MVNQVMEHSNMVKVGNKRVGEIVSKSFIKRVIGSKHMLKAPRAWAIDAGVFENVIKPNCSEIIIKDAESGWIYQVSMEVFDAFKGTLDRGFGKQYFLTIGYWQLAIDDTMNINLKGA